MATCLPLSPADHPSCGLPQDTGHVLRQPHSRATVHTGLLALHPLLAPLMMLSKEVLKFFTKAVWPCHLMSPSLHLSLPTLLSHQGWSMGSRCTLHPMFPPCSLCSQGPVHHCHSSFSSCSSMPCDMWIKSGTHACSLALLWSAEYWDFLCRWGPRLQGQALVS